MHIRQLRRASQYTYVSCSTPLNTHTSVAARLSMHKRRLQHASQYTYVGCGAPFNAQTPVAAHVPRMMSFYGAGLKPCKAYTSDHAFPRRALPHSVLKRLSGPRKLTQAGTARRRPRHDARRAIAPRRRASYCANAKNMQVCIDNRFVILYNLTTDSYLLCMKQPHVLHTAQPLFPALF